MFPPQKKKKITEYRLDLQNNDVVEVIANKKLRVMLLDQTDLLNYKEGNYFRWYGGQVKEYPYRIKAPYEGTWFLKWDNDPDPVLPTDIRMKVIPGQATPLGSWETAKVSP